MNKQRAQSIYKTIMLIILTAAITFIITSVVMYKQDGTTKIKYITNNSGSIESTFKTFHNFINEHYIGEINETEMLESAIKGYVYGLKDEYSEYITKEEMQEYMADATGKYVGIGVYITNNTKTNQIVVVMPIKGSPAEAAGIQAGDIITKVDGIAYTGEELSKATAALKQQEGTKVQVEILRGQEVLTIEVERKEIKVSHIESEVLDGNIGYIQIATFDDGCYEEFKEVWQKLKDQKVTSIILDLRNNGGGIVEESIKIADIFTNKGDILLITSGKKENEEIEKAKEEKQIDLPVVILVNENTASASEILTAAIKENNQNVKIVGKNTYGKGVIQTIFTLTDGSGLKLTTSQYYTPKHNVINKLGIKPDEEVDLPEGKTIYSIVQKQEDTQLQKAIEILK